MLIYNVTSPALSGIFAISNLVYYARSFIHISSPPMFAYYQMLRSGCFLNDYFIQSGCLGLLFVWLVFIHEYSFFAYFHIILCL